VTATEGRMPTTTVRPPISETMLAVSATVRAKNESRVSTDEISSTTPLASTRCIAASTSSWSAETVASSGSEGTVTIKVLRTMMMEIELRSLIGRTSQRLFGESSTARRRSRSDTQLEQLECRAQPRAQRRARRDIGEIDPQVHECLCDRWPYACEHHLRTEQPYCSDGLDEVLSGLSIDGRYAGDVEQRNGRGRLHHLVEQHVHQLLSALAVERADERYEQDSGPYLHHRDRGHLENLLRLPADFVLGLPASRQVAGYLAEAAQPAFLVAQGRDDDVGPESRAVLAYPPTLVLEAPLLRGHFELHLGLAVLQVLRRIEAREVLADDLVGLPALQALGGRIPGEYVTTRVQGDDRVVPDVVDEQAHELLRLRRGLAGRGPWMAAGPRLELRSHQSDSHTARLETKLTALLPAMLDLVQTSPDPPSRGAAGAGTKRARAG